MAAVDSRQLPADLTWTYLTSAAQMFLAKVKLVVEFQAPVIIGIDFKFGWQTWKSKVDLCTVPKFWYISKSRIWEELTKSRPETELRIVKSRNARTFCTNKCTVLPLSNFIFILIKYMNKPYPVVNLLQMECITLVVKITDYSNSRAYWTSLCLKDFLIFIHNFLLFKLHTGKNVIRGHSITTGYLIAKIDKYFCSGEDIDFDFCYYFGSYMFMR